MIIKDAIEQLQDLKCHCSDMERGEAPGNEWMKDVEVLDFAIATLKQEPKTEWIPVSKELPEEGEEVLVWYEYFRYGDYNCMWQTYGIGWQYDGHFSVDNGGVKQKVIAWCPLPKKYKESEE